MISYLDIEDFITTSITKRTQSLLKEDFIKYESELNSRINGKKVLVIGGAGTIGSYYIKAILKFKIIKLVVVDVNENALTELVRDLRSSSRYNIPDDFVTYPINFGDSVFEKMFRNLAPFDIVANFAAHKHVRSEKDIYSIEAMIDNNLFHSRKLLNLLLEFSPEHFFCVSTDKAANPVNIMGASKKLMEEMIMAYSNKFTVTTARFANVAFSNGSLLQGFIDRLYKQQPWSCPLGIYRYFVSPQESGELCLIASVLGKTGDIFFPKLDEKVDMISFDKIAIDLLKHLGMKPDICSTEEEARQKSLDIAYNSLKDPTTRICYKYPVYFFGSDSSGEKSFEEFYTEKEELDHHSFQNLGVIKNSLKRDIAEIDAIFDKLNCLFESNKSSKHRIVEILNDYLPNFNHIEKGKGLDSKM
jgi:FlaA1/EpsC-like NDP-sugar epimerase